MNWGYVFAGAGLLLAFLGLLFKLVLDRKEATIQKLNTDISSLQRQLSEAKDNAPDARAERLLKKIGILEKDIELLSKDHAKNEQALVEKVEELEKTNQELENLKQQVERTNELLDEASYYKEQFGCPVCGAELTTLAGEDVEVRVYACGNTSGPEQDYPCPYDPEFPTLDDYTLEVKTISPNRVMCRPKPKTKNGYKLTLQPQFADTEEEAKQKIITNYERSLPKKFKQPQVNRV